MLIAGAGGHSLEVFEILKENSTTPLTFFDENQNSESSIEGFPLISSFEIAQNFLKSNPSFCLGVGNPKIREKFENLFVSLGGRLTSVISKSSIIQSDIEHVDVMSFSFIGPKVKLGKGVLVNTRANVHHECEVGEFSELGPGVILLGNVKIGKGCRIGAGAVILPGLTLGDEVVVGAGSVVTKSLDSYLTVAGVPATTSFNFKGRD